MQNEQHDPWFPHELAVEICRSRNLWLHQPESDTFAFLKEFKNPVADFEPYDDLHGKLEEYGSFSELLSASWTDFWRRDDFDCQLVPPHLSSTPNEDYVEPQLMDVLNIARHYGSDCHLPDLRDRVDGLMYNEGSISMTSMHLQSSETLATLSTSTDHEGQDQGHPSLTYHVMETSEGWEVQSDLATSWLQLSTGTQDKNPSGALLISPLRVCTRRHDVSSARISDKPTLTLLTDETSGKPGGTVAVHQAETRKRAFGQAVAINKEHTHDYSSKCKAHSKRLQLVKIDRKSLRRFGDKKRGRGQSYNVCCRRGLLVSFSYIAITCIQQGDDHIAPSGFAQAWLQSQPMCKELFAQWKVNANMRTDRLPSYTLDVSCVPGGYDSEIAAARAYDIAALWCKGPTTPTNFDPMQYRVNLEQLKGLPREAMVAYLRRQSSAYARGKSPYRGVSGHHGRWEARIGSFDGRKNVSFGIYETEEEAARGYDRALIVERGLDAKTNFCISEYINETEAAKATDVNDCFTRPFLDTSSMRFMRGKNTSLIPEEANFTPDYENTESFCELYRQAIHRIQASLDKGKHNESTMPSKD
eukprot:SM000079S22441  [mRNA]  locus=s79:201692:211589:+ [translate_table: standard]